MKLRSITLAGLLGAGLILTSGCTEDDVKDLVNENSSAVYVVNDLSGGIIAEVEGTQKPVVSMDIAVVFPTISTDDSLNVHYVQGGPDIGDVQVTNNGMHVYAATDCNAKTHLVDTYDGNKIRIMNLTEAAVLKGNIELLHNGVAVALPSDATACAVTSTFTGDTTGIWSVTVGGQAYNDVDLTRNIGFEIVIYDTGTNKGTVVPLVGFDDIL